MRYNIICIARDVFMFSNNFGKGISVEETLRNILSETANLSVPAATIGSGDDLFAAGLTSFATVGVMLAVESEFDVEFPDSLLVRSTFTSINALAAAVKSLKGD